MSESRECRAGGWRLHQLGELPSECGACEAYAKGREDFRREVAEALEVVLRDFESESFGCQNIERATREARSYAEAAKALNMQGAYNYAAARVAGLLKKLEAGTFPKPPPSSGGGGGGT